MIEERRNKQRKQEKDTQSATLERRFVHISVIDDAKEIQKQKRDEKKRKLEEREVTSLLPLSLSL